MSSLVLLFVLFVFFISKGKGISSIRKKTYQQLKTGVFCIKTLDDVGSYGCSGNKNGNNGVAILLKNTLDLKILDHLKKKRFVAVLSRTNYQSEFIKALKKFPSLQGIVVLAQSKKPRGTSTSQHSSFKESDGFTLGLKSPNHRKGLYQIPKNWNPRGEDQLFSLNVPMVYFDDKKEINEILKCANTNIIKQKRLNSTLCYIELKTWMFGASNSFSCLKREFCDPLKGYNVFSTLPGPKKSSFVLAVTSLDSTALFKDRANGASVVSSVVALLAAADALKRTKSTQLQKNIMFALFDGESHDYIGSSRFVIDLSNKKFFLKQNTSISLNNIDSIVELGQIGSRGNPKSPIPLFIFRDSSKLSQEKTENITNSVLNAFDNKNIKVFENPHLLPPSSLQSFFKWGDRNIPGVVITDHAKTFSNKYFQSIFDDWENIGATKTESLENLCFVSTSYARSLYLIAGGNHLMLHSINSNCRLIKTILKSITINMNTSLMRTLFDDVNCTNTKSSVCQFNRPLSSYVGVNQNSISKFSMSFVSYLLFSKFLGVKVNKTKTECLENNSMNESFVWTFGKCYNTPTSIKVAISPAFDYATINKSFSTWTESRWDFLSSRIYYQPKIVSELLDVSLGVFLLSISLFTMYYFKKNFE